MSTVTGALFKDKTLPLKYKQGTLLESKLFGSMKPIIIYTTLQFVYEMASQSPLLWHMCMYLSQSKFPPYTYAYDNKPSRRLEMALINSNSITARNSGIYGAYFRLVLPSADAKRNNS